MLGADRMASDHQRRRQVAVTQTLGDPGPLAVGAAPGDNFPVTLDAKNIFVITVHTDRAQGRLTPQQAATGSVDTTHGGLKSAHANHVANAAGPPTRSTRRSISLVPRGEAMGASQRTAPLDGLSPTRRPPMPVTKVSPTANKTPDCRSTRDSPGRCWFQSLRPEPARF